MTVQGSFKAGKMRVTVFEDWINIMFGDKFQLCIGEPDSEVSPDNEFDLSVYISDHARLFVRGLKKEQIDLLVLGDEYPTTLNGKPI